MKKTLLATIDFPPMFGGVANYWANLNKHLPADELVVLAPEYDDSHSFDIKQNYLIYRKILISKNKWLWPKWLPLFYYLFRLIKMEKIKKVIVAQLLPVGTAALILKYFLKFDYLVSVHGMDVKISKKGSRKYKIMLKVLQKAKKIIANSNYTKAEVIKLGIPSEKISVIYPCPNVKNENIDRDFKQDFIKKYDLTNKKILLTVGRLVERKGHDRVIQALPEIARQFPNTIYLIVGEGENLENLKQLSARHNLKQNILFLENVCDDELRVLYDLTDVFIMTSRELTSGDVEGFGIVYLEANNFKKPVIAGKTGGAVEAVEHGINGLLVDSNKFNEISKAVIKLFGSQEYADNLGERGYQRNKNRFCWPVQAEKLEKLLNI